MSSLSRVPAEVSGAVPRRLVFFVSDGTGITAQTLGSALLINFPGFEFETCSFPFVDTAVEAEAVLREITDAAAAGVLPLLFTTVKVPAVLSVLAHAPAAHIDLFRGHITELERVLGAEASEQLGQYHGLRDAERYFTRMRAVEYAIEHDDGQSMRALDLADVVIIGPSRCGKTPTTMYLALQYGMRVANYPLIDDDFATSEIPPRIAPYVTRCFGLTTNPLRLSQVRRERRPDSPYASLEQCAFEVREAEELYRRFGIPFLNSAMKSVEEMSVVIRQAVRKREKSERRTDAPTRKE